MPWTTIAPGAPITSAWANANVRDQAVSYFATAAARAAAIPSPTAGLVSYLADSRELQIYTTASTGWQRPWNMPWGIPAGGDAADGSSSVIAAGVGSTEASPAPLRTPSFTFVANRKVLVTGTMHFTASGAVTGKMRIRRGSGTGGAELMNGEQRLPDLLGALGPITVSFVDKFYTPGANSYSFTGVGADLRAPWQWSVQDVGPNGAPA